MRSLAIAAFAGLSILAAAPAAAGGQQRGGWADTPTMPLNMPGRTIAAPPAQGWHGHDAPAPRPQGNWNGGSWQNGSYQNGSSQGGANQHGGQGNWQRPPSGNWQQGKGHGNSHGSYTRPYRGYRLDRVWLSPGYAIGNWDFYGLGQPGYGRHWVRYYDDAVLIDDGGTVFDTVDSLDWDRPAYAADYDARASWGQEVSYGAKYGGMAPGSYYAPPAPVAQPAPHVAYAPQPQPMYAPPMVTYGSAVSYVTPAVSTVIVQSAPVMTTTTTTTTFVEEVYRTPVRHWAPKPVHRAPRRVVSCCCLCR